MDSGDEYEYEYMCKEMLEYIFDGNQSHLNVNRREAHNKIRDLIKKIQPEWKGALLSILNVGKGLNKVFKTVVKNISQDLPIFGESGSEVSYFILDPRNFSEVTRLSDDIKKPFLKSNQKEIKNLISNHSFLVQEPEKGEPVTPCMDVYKTKIQSDGSLYNLKLIIVVRGDM